MGDRTICRARTSARCTAAASAAALACVLSGGPALAGTALVDAGTIRYTAAAGEANAVVLIVRSDSVRINDRGAPIVAGPGCTTIHANSVRCFQPDDDSVLDIAVRTRDGHDTIKAWPLSPSGAQTAALRLSGGDGPDYVHTCVYRTASANFLSGGAGDDRIAFCTDDLSLGLRPPANYVYGGAGNDTLTGSLDEDMLFGEQGRDVMYGKGGRDILRGGGGPDRLYGGPHRDALRGGAGQDHLISRDRWSDQVHGGPGRDAALVDWRDGVSAVEDLLP